MRCTNCESENIVKKIEWGVSGEFSRVGPKYSAFFDQVERVFCDICDDCGEVVRIYVDPKEKRNWLSRER